MSLRIEYDFAGCGNLRKFLCRVGNRPYNERSKSVSVAVPVTDVCADLSLRIARIKMYNGLRRHRLLLDTAIEKFSRANTIQIDQIANRRTRDTLR